MDDIHNQARTLKDKVRSSMDVTNGSSQSLIKMADDFLEFVEMKKDPRHLIDAIKRIEQAARSVGDEVMSPGEVDDIIDRAQDLRKALEKIKR